MLLPDKLRPLFFQPISWVLLAGFLLRLYSAIARCIVNADAHHYIYQAQAIYCGEWSSILSCGVNHPSTYPFFTAMAFFLLRDWIVAGLAVNVVFGSATLIPLYYLLRRFLDKTACTLTVLVFALIPTFVNSSGDIVRGPVFWFFLVSGMLFFVRHWDEQAKTGRYRYDLAISGLSFTMATGTRIEGVIFLAVSALYMIFCSTDRKAEKLLAFLSPLIIGGMMAFAVVLLSGANPASALRADKVWSEITQFISQYGLLDNQIKSVVAAQKGILGEFLRRTREALWLMPLAVLLHNIIEIFYYPFALVFFIGFAGIGSRIRQHKRAGYFLWLMAGSMLVLVVHLLQTWIFIHRFLAIFIYPSGLVIGWGVANSMQYLQTKFVLRQATAVSLVVFFFVLSSAPKLLMPNEMDKRVYRQAARLIQDRQDPDRDVKIAAARASRAYEWVQLYSHRTDPAPVCAKRLIDRIPASYDEFRSNLDRDGITYILYEERYWPKKSFDLPSSPYQQDFKVLGQWKHQDSGVLMLLQRIEK